VFNIITITGGLILVTMLIGNIKVVAEDCVHIGTY